MCGIGCFILKRKPCPCIINDLQSRFFAAISRRGPDAWNTTITTTTSGYCVMLVSSLLHVRGADVISQPIQLNNGILAYNGEVYDGVEMRDDECDTRAFGQALELGDDKLNDVHGCYAFVYVNPVENIVKFGRDSLGRRCLMMCSSIPVVHAPSCDDGDNVCMCGIFSCFTPSSSSPLRELAEVPPHGVYTMSLSSSSSSLRYNFSICCRMFHRNNWDMKLVDDNAKDTLHRLLSDAVRKRVSFSGDVAILFSGGLDCSVIASLASAHMSSDRVIDLINVSFGNKGGADDDGLVCADCTRDVDEFTLELHNMHVGGRVIDTTKDTFWSAPDRLTALHTLRELSVSCRARRWRLLCVDIATDHVTRCHDYIMDLIHPHNTVMDHSIATSLYYASRCKALYHVEFNVDKLCYVITVGAVSSPARVLLSGLGADELLCGYSRHRTTFISSGNDPRSLVGAIREEVLRLWTRNLGMR